MKTALLLATLCILILGGGYFWMGGVSALSRNTGSISTTSSSSGRYTYVQVASHNTSSNCWAIISGNVYNLTSWIAQHPGGEASILTLCGKDGTGAFEGQHGSGGRANTELAAFKIGTVTQ